MRWTIRLFQLLIRRDFTLVAVFLCTLGLGLANPRALEAIEPAHSSSTAKAEALAARAENAANESENFLLAAELYFQAYELDRAGTDYLYSAARAFQKAQRLDEAARHYAAYLANPGRHLDKVEKAREHAAEVERDRTQSGRFTIDESGQFVTDRLTGLTWERGAEKPPVDWSGAAERCRRMTSGYGGWRLPAVDEIPVSALGTGSHVFPNTSGSWHWTGTVGTRDTGTVAIVDFNTGESRWARDSVRTVLPATCVRGTAKSVAATTAVTPEHLQSNDPEQDDLGKSPPEVDRQPGLEESAKSEDAPGTLRLTGWAPSDEVRIDGVLRRLQSSELRIGFRLEFELVVLRPGNGPWRTRLKLESGETRDVALVWGSVGFIGLQPGDQLFADDRPLSVGDGKVQLQEWPAKFIWQRGDVRLPVLKQTGTEIRLPAALRVTSSSDDLVFRMDDEAGKAQVLSQIDIVAVEPGTHANGRFELRGYLPRPQPLGTLQPGQVLDLRLQESDFMVDPEWQLVRKRESLRRWAKGAVWTGGIVTAVAIASVLVAANFERAANLNTADYRTAADTNSTKQLRSIATENYASSATWQNAAIGTGTAGGLLLLGGIGTLLGFQSMPEPDATALTSRRE